MRASAGVQATREQHRIRTGTGEIVFDVSASTWRLVKRSRGREAVVSSPWGDDPSEVFGEALEGPFPWPLARYPDTVPTMVLNTHQECNLRCQYCYAHRVPHDYERPPMTMEVAKRAVEFLLTEFSGEASSVVLRSSRLGEPALSPDFVGEVLDYARARAASEGKRLEWDWGPTNLAAPLPEELKQHPLKWISVSLDGPREVHDFLRPRADGSGSYDTVLRNARELRESLENPFGPGFGGNAVLTAIEPDVTRLFLHQYEAGFDGISIMPVALPPGHEAAIDGRSIGEVKAGYSRFAEFLLSQDPDKLLTYLRKFFHPWDYLGRFLMRVLQPSKVPYRCPAGKWEIDVDTNGDIYPCTPFIAPKAFRMGSIFTGIEPEKQRLWAEDLFIDNRETCKDCWARYLCGGNCYYQAFLATGSPEQPSPVECELTRHVAETALRIAAGLSEKYPELLAALPLARPSGARGRPTLFCDSRSADGNERAAEHRWSSSRPVELAEGGLVRWKRWRGPDDLSVQLHVCWDDRTLRVRAAVRDDVAVPPRKTSRFLEGDSVEVSLYRMADGERRYSFLMSSLTEGPDVVGYEASGGQMKTLSSEECGAECDIHRTGGITDYRLTLPWAGLPGLAPGREFGFALRVNDDDEDTRGYLEWPADAPYAVVRYQSGRAE